MVREKIALSQPEVYTTNRDVIKKVAKPPRGLLIAACATVAAVLGAAGTGFADISGFGNGTGYTLTGYTQDANGNITDNNAPTISSGTLTLTTAGAGEARAAFFNTPQSISNFTVGFTFQTAPTSFAPLGPSDGFAFVLQNDSRGTSAIGGGGAGLGYGLMNNNQPPSGSPVLTAITPSAATEFFLRNGNGASNFETGGTIDPNVGNAVGSVSLVSGDAIAVLLSYDGTTLAETLTDLSTSQTYQTSYAENLASALGGNTAYIGFTGGTGGGYSTQSISNFTYSSTVPEPAPLAVLALGGLGLLLLTRGKKLEVRS
ncbi:MAG: hypothetical protein M0Z50_00665 [Planctomycetia bacterium]|nr:hypothetical protein [Planctomycetia bacterium]